MPADEARVEQDRRYGNEAGRLGLAEPGDRAAGRRNGDTEQDERVRERPAPDRRERDDDDRDRAERVAENGDQSGGDECQVFLRLGDRRAAHGLGERHRDRHADRQPGVDEAEGRRPAPAGEQERADPEQRGREQASEQVVHAECAVVPPGGCAPGERRRRRARRRSAMPAQAASCGARLARYRQSRSPASRGARSAARNASNASMAREAYSCAGADLPGLYPARGVVTCATRDYYVVLGVPRDADRVQIRKAYRASPQSSIRTSRDEPDAPERFRELAEAYQVLSDPDARRRYDRLGRPRRGLFDDLFAAHGPAAPARRRARRRRSRRGVRRLRRGRRVGRPRGDVSRGRRLRPCGATGAAPAAAACLPLRLRRLRPRSRGRRRRPRAADPVPRVRALPGSRLASSIGPARLHGRGACRRRARDPRDDSARIGGRRRDTPRRRGARRRARRRARRPRRHTARPGAAGLAAPASPRRGRRRCARCCSSSRSSPLGARAGCGRAAGRRFVTLSS